MEDSSSMSSLPMDSSAPTTDPHQAFLDAYDSIDQGEAAFYILGILGLINAGLPISGWLWYRNSPPLNVNTNKWFYYGWATWYVGAITLWGPAFFIWLLAIFGVGEQLFFQWFSGLRVATFTVYLVPIAFFALAAFLTPVYGN